MNKKAGVPPTSATVSGSARTIYSTLAIYERALNEFAPDTQITATWQSDRRPEPAIFEPPDLGEAGAELWPSVAPPNAILRPRAGHSSLGRSSAPKVVALVAVLGLDGERLTSAVRQIEARQLQDGNFTPLFLTDNPNQTAIRHAGYNLEYLPQLLYGDPERTGPFRERFFAIWKKWAPQFLFDLSKRDYLRSRLGDDLNALINPDLQVSQRFNPRMPAAEPIAPAAVDVAGLKAEYASKTLDQVPDTFVLYRVIGNDLPPRHKDGQTLDNLQFILKNEPPLKDCDRRWIVNRIIDERSEAEIIALLEAHDQPYTRLPFDMDEYRRIDWDFSAFDKAGFFYREDYAGMTDYDRSRADVQLRRLKNNYVMNNNGARNAALRDGRARAKWVLPWDGNCFLTKKCWSAITRDVRLRPYMKYLTVPMWRAPSNGELLSKDLEPEEFSEPQIIFRCDTAEDFDERFPYGRRPKIELFWRLGIPGYWDSWRDDVWDLPRPLRSPDAGSVGQAGWVARLASGREDLEDHLSTGLVGRGMARNEAIISVIDRLDRKSIEGVYDPANLTAYHDSTVTSLALAPANTAKAQVYERLLFEADLALQRGPYSVTEKSVVPPSGDKHDYYHPAPYWWPSPDTPTGLPGSYRDGDRAPGTELYEPESDRYDRTRLQRLFDDTAILALAGASSGDQKYLRHAALLVRHWFLEDTTRMNPNLEFAQVRPGTDDGSGRGIIEMKDLYFFLDAVRLLIREEALAPAEQVAFRQWLRDYLNWLLSSEMGIFERQAHNNHGTCYDLQVGSIAAFLGDTALLVETIRRSCERVGEQFDREGGQPFELKRTQTAHYCCFNLQCWVHLANLAESCGLKLWSFQTADGRSLLKAFEWLLMKSKGKWPFKQIKPFDNDRFLPLAYTAQACCEVPGADRNAMQSFGKPLYYPHDGIAPFWMLSASFHTAQARGGSELTRHVRSFISRSRAQDVEEPEPRTVDFADKRLWGGYSAKGQEDLKRITKSLGARTLDRDLAAFALARWHQFNNDPRSALESLRRIALPRQRAQMATVLLETECLANLGEREEARALVSEALERNPDDPSLFLAMANTYAGPGDQANPATEAERLGWINRLFSVNGLAPLELKNPSEPLGFFNIAGAKLPKTLALRSGDLPKVSIIMPVFDAAETIHVAVTSLLEQTWPNIQIIVVDDASTDRSAEIVETMSRNDARITLVRLPENGGAYPARNAGLDLADGEFVTVHDSDDWSHPQKIELQVRELLKPNAATGVFSDWARVTPDLFALGYWRRTSTLSGQNQSSLMLPRELLETLGRWDEVRVGADNEMIWRIKVRYGQNVLATVLPDVPLAFGLVRDASLTRQSQTHVRTVFHGLRRDYHRSYRNWQKGQDPKELKLPRADGGSRAFPAPRAILPSTSSPVQYQRVYISDFARSAPMLERIVPCIESDLEGGTQVAIFHWPDYERDGDLVFDTRIGELLDEGRIEQVSAFQDARAETLVFCDVLLARYPLDGLPDFGCEQVEVWYRYSGSLDMVFDPRRPAPSRAELEKLFKAQVRWIQI